MFVLERFIADCQAIPPSLDGQGDRQRAIHELLTRELRDPAAVLKSVGEPKRAGVNTLYHSPELTVLNLVWGPHMTLMPHNHQMWAVIGLYTGREDNIFWRRVPNGPQGLVEAAGAKALGVKDCAALGKDVIHSVTNPVPRLTGAIHIYGGDFFNEPRSEWDSEALTERPMDVARTVGLFEESNARLAG